MEGKHRSSFKSERIKARTQELANMRVAGWRVDESDTCSAIVAFLVDNNGTVCVKAWRGAAEKPTFFRRYRQMPDAKACASDFLHKVERDEKLRADKAKSRIDQRAKLRASDFWVVGDVVYNSWGWNQTNIHWYQVVEVKAKSVVIRALARNFREATHMIGPSQPRRNDFVGGRVLKILNEDGGIPFRFGYGQKWDGTAVWESHDA